jgi:putative ABC transport system substrate-binding protein
MQDTEVSAKRLELVREVLPKVARIAVLHDPAGPEETRQATETAARSLGLALQVVTAARPADFEGAFAAARRRRAEALVILASSVFNEHRRRLVELAATHRLVTVYEHRLFPEAGGLMSYGPDLVYMNRRAATYVDRILKGAKPADLPIERRPPRAPGRPAAIRGACVTERQRASDRNTRRVPAPRPAQRGRSPLRGGDRHQLRMTARLT